MKIIGKLIKNLHQPKSYEAYLDNEVMIDSTFGLDYKDYQMLKEITDKFLNGSWEERIELYERLLRK